MYIFDLYGNKYHRLFVYIQYRNLTNYKIQSSMEVIEDYAGIYDVSLNLTLLKEVDIMKYKIYYSHCGLVNLLRPTTIKNKHLLKDCDFNITKFNEEMKKNTTIDHYIWIEFDTWKFYINPNLDDKGER